MEHLFEQVRPPIDRFELTLINAFLDVMNVHAIWVRELPIPPKPTPFGEKRVVKRCWLQLVRRPKNLDVYYARSAELLQRCEKEPYVVHLEWCVDELPPAVIAPSCIFRRDRPQRN